jgi:hypothetical protein
MGKSNFMLAVLLGVLFAGPSFGSGNSYTIEDALNRKLITVSITGRKDATTAYYGGCITLIISNTSNQNLSIRLENGRRLNCVNDTIQDMLVTQSEMMALVPSQKKELTIYAMCSQKHDRSPKPNSVFRLGAMAESQIVKLTALIEKYNVQNYTGQEAVWVLTDNEDPSSISGDDQEIVKLLRECVTGAVVEQKKVNTREPGFIYDYSYPKVDENAFTIEGDFAFQMSYKNFVSLYIYDNYGNRIKVVFQDVPYSTGMQNYHYKITSSDFRPGELYWLRMKSDSKTLKELAIQMD